MLAEGRLYYLTRNGRMFVLAAKPEFEQLAMNDLDDGSRFDGSPAVSVLFGTAEAAGQPCVHPSRMTVEGDTQVCFVEVEGRLRFGYLGWGAGCPCNTTNGAV